MLNQLKILFIGLVCGWLFLRGMKKKFQGGAKLYKMHQNKPKYEADFHQIFPNSSFNSRQNNNFKDTAVKPTSPFYNFNI